MWELVVILLLSVSIPLSMFAQKQTEDVGELMHNPILIIPGILGTKILKNYGDNAELWPRITALVTSSDDSFLEDISLAENGTEIIERPMRIGDIVRSISFGIDVHPYIVGRISVTASHIFDKFILELETFGYQEGVDLFVFPYDWRLDNRLQANSIQNAIERILNTTGSQKVTIVAHSMGGLLAKEYLAKYGAGLIENVFFVGTPHLGAPKAFKALMYGDNMGIKVPIKGKFTSLLNPDRVKSISQNMPSVYELLPSEKYLESTSYLSKENVALKNNDIAGLMRSSGRNGTLIDNAKEFHNGIDDLSIQANVYNFVGCNDEENTLGGIEIKKKKPWLSFLGEADEYLLHFVKGDETVPVASAFLQDANNFFIKGVSHGELPSTEGLGTLVASVINGIEYDMPTSISSNTDLCGGIEGIIVSKHSPVEMHIYDEYGNHTGPIESGDIEYGIPNVTYEQIESTAYSFMPIGEKYTIVNTPNNEGIFDFYAEYVNKDGEVIKKQSWNEIQIHSLESSFELNISKDGINDMEEISGDNREAISPTSILTGNALSDTEPPVTTAISKEGRIALSSVDNISGTEKTEYSLDGEKWEVYREPISILEGHKILFLSIDNAGNIEEEKSYIAPTSTMTKPEKENVSGSKPITNIVNISNDTVEKTTQVVPSEKPKVVVEAKKEDIIQSKKSVVRKGVKIKRRITASPVKKTTEDVVEKPGPKGFFMSVWSKIKTALYYAIWHMKAIIS